MANTYKVDADDPRLTGIKSEENKAVQASDAMYHAMYNDAGKYYDKQIDAVADWQKEQTKQQNAQTDFAIEKIEQQRDQAHSDYIKEQSGAYTDWQKQSNPYGAKAEAMAAQGMGKTGYSESSQVSMYNTYQNRVATAREAFSRAVLNYDNAITEARLANSSALAKIAYESLQKQLELSLAGFQYKNTLLVEKANAARAIKSDYWQRYNAMYGNIQQENALNETARYHDEQIKLAQAELQLDRDKFNYQKEQAAASSSSGGGKIKKSGSSSSGSSSGKGAAVIDKKNAAKQINHIKEANKTTKTKEATPDMNSVLALGYGPIGASRLNQLIKEGKVKEYRDGDKLKYKKVFSYR